MAKFLGYRQNIGLSVTQRKSAADGRGSIDLVIEVIDERENELVAWRSIEGSDVRVEGRVAFRDAPAGPGTVVEALIGYHPSAGERGRWVFGILGQNPGVQAGRELKQFKMLMKPAKSPHNRCR